MPQSRHDHDEPKRDRSDATSGSMRPDDSTDRRASEQVPDTPVGLPTQLSAAQLMGIQRSAGNNAVTVILHRDGPRSIAGPATRAPTTAVQRQAAHPKPGLGGIAWAGKGEIKLWERDDISKFFQDVDFDGWYLNVKKATVTYDGKLDISEEGRGTSRGGVQIGSAKDTGLKFEEKLRESKGSILGAPAKIGVKGGFELLGGKTGVSATMYGQLGPAYGEGKVFAGVKYDADKKPELVAGNLTFTGAGQAESKEIHLGEGILKFSGKLGIAVELEPNWKKITSTLLEEVLPVAAEAAATAGPPLLFAAITAMAIIEAGDKADLYRGLVGYALDARRAAAIAYLTLSGAGDGLTTTGPVSAAAKAAAESELIKAAAASNLSLASLKELMRASSDKQQNDVRVRYEQCRAQATAALEQKALESVSVWRKDHSFTKFWTSFEDQMSEARRHYRPIMDSELSLRDVLNAPVY
jgi:hypothetical protein